MSDWEETTLGALFDPIKDRVDPATVPGGRFVGMEHMVTGEPRVRQWGHANDVSSSSPIFRSGDVLFGRLRPYLRKVALADFDGICSGEILVWRPRLNRVRPEFLQFVAASDAVISDAVEKSAGSRMPRVSSADLSATPVLLPSLPEQDQIISIIRAVEEQIHCLQREAASLRALYAGHLDRLWLDVDGATAPLRSLSEVMELSINRVQLVDSHTYRLAGVLNAGQGLIDKGIFNGDETGYKTMNLLEANYVVMRKLTAWEGPIAVIGEKFNGFVASSEFPTFRLTGVLPAYFAHLCRTERLRHEMKQRVTGSVQRRKRLNPDQLLAVELPIPAAEAQDTVAAQLDSIARSEAAVSTEASQLQSIRSGILRGLLTRDVTIDNRFDATLMQEAA
ncbi:MAG: restriction endonuclease subunit S [Actinomycetota bacterium]